MKTAQLSFDQLMFSENGVPRQFRVAGVDEVGRGPLAGNVVSAAVILHPERGIEGLADSKKLTETQRESLFDEICDKATGYAFGEAGVDEIDQLNILHASMLSMARAIEALPLKPDHCLIDGNRCPQVSHRCQAVVGGDALVKEIAAASILAKVYRDRQMRQLHRQYPDYGFDRHKGYPTREHLQAIRAFGVLSQHRRSFGPIRKVLHNELEIA